MAVTPTAADLGVSITQGTVVRASSHILGGTIYRDQSSATIQSTPEIWLQDETGREHYYRSRTFDGIRDGHELIMVHDAKNGALLRVTNRNTRATIDLRPLVPDTGGWAVIRAVTWRLLIIYLPVVFYGATVVRETGQTDTILGWLFGIATNILLVYCGYLGWRAAKNTAAKTRERRAGLDALFRQNGWIKDKAA